MIELEEIDLGKVKLYFKEITGEVTDHSKVHASNVTSEKNYFSNEIKVRTSHKIKQEIWITGEDGTEYDLKLENSEVPLRVGQLVSVVYCSYSEREKGEPCFIVNHASKKYNVLRLPNDMLGSSFLSVSLYIFNVVILVPFVILFLTYLAFLFAQNTQQETLISSFPFFAIISYWAYKYFKGASKIKRIKQNLMDHIDNLSTNLMKKYSS